MKILYMISCRGASGKGYTGKGGHYYSILETARAMSRNNEVLICSVGKGRSLVLDSSEVPYTHIQVKGLLAGFAQLFKLAKSNRPDVINAFDKHSFFWARTLSWWFNIPLVLTKCGGANPGKYYPRAQSLVLYSLENLEYFERHKRFSNTNRFLIPNRINVESNCKVDTNRINKLSERLDPHAITVLRISRISLDHKESIVQSINLIKVLNARGIKSQLLVIGVVQDQKVFETLAARSGESVIFVTDSEFTVNASELIDVADIVIGTGRGFMEAALLGKKMLVPTANTKLPMPVNESNFEDAFYYNFSSRCISKTSEEINIKEVVSCVEKSSEKMKMIYEQKFSSVHINEKYARVYSSALPQNSDILDYLAHLLLVCKYPI